MFRQALRMTARDWRAGQLRFLLVALVVAVAALSAAGFFIDRLRGGVKVNTDIAQANESIGAPAPAAPEPGTVWIDPALATSLDVAVGASVQLGDKQFRVTQLIAAEPDRGGGFINFAPRVFLA